MARHSGAARRMPALGRLNVGEFNKSVPSRRYNEGCGRGRPPKTRLKAGDLRSLEVWWS